MSITTVDGVINGMLPSKYVLKNGATTVAARMYSPFYVTGSPGAATAPSLTIGPVGTSLSAYTGQIEFVPSGTSINTYLANFTATINTPGTLYLCDRLWHNSMTAVTSVATQTINSATFPPRSLTGGTEGMGVMIGVEVSTVLGAGTPAYIMTYTNDKGESGRITQTAAQTATMAVGSFIPIALGTGDTGVRSIQSWRQTATHTSGVYHLVAYRVLASVNVPQGGVKCSADAFNTGLVRMFDNTVPFLLWQPSTTTAPSIQSEITYTKG